MLRDRPAQAVGDGLRPDAGNPILAQGFAGNFYELSTGLNYTPTANLTLRGEVRYDKFSGVSTTTPGLEPYGDGTRTDQVLFSIDGIYLF